MPYLPEYSRATVVFYMEQNMITVLGGRQRPEKKNHIREVEFLLSTAFPPGTLRELINCS